MRSTILLALGAIAATAAFLTGALGHHVWAGVLAMTALLSLWGSNKTMDEDMTDNH